MIDVSDPLAKRYIQELDEEAQKIATEQIYEVVTPDGINWQNLEVLQMEEQKCGGSPLSNGVFDHLEKTGVLDSRNGYGAYAWQGGSLLNIGPSRQMLVKYYFRELAELKRYISECYGEAQYPIVSVHTGNITRVPREKAAMQKEI